MRTQIKICGVRDTATAEVAAAGADLIGFIMCPRFWRYIPPEAVKSICNAVPQSKKAGVFVDQPAEFTATAAAYCGLDFIQLHGHESPAYARRLRELLINGTQGRAPQIIKALRYGEDFSPELANNYPAELILIDSYSQNSEGGSGISFAWQSAAPAIKKVKKPYLIAGGISAENLQEAVTAFAPYGIDVSSSLERERQKQPDLIRNFLEKAGRL